MVIENIREVKDVLQRLTRRIKEFPLSEITFRLARKRGYIPRDGFYPDSKFQFSVRPMGDYFYDFSKIKPLIIPYEDPIAATDLLTKSWQTIQFYRLLEESHYANFTDKNEILPPVAFAPTTERLFKEIIAPAIKKHCKNNNKPYLAVDNVSYLLPFWSQKELGSVKIVEGELSRLIKERGKLPDTVGAVFLEFPQNQQKKEFEYDKEDLVEFMKNNKGVLIIIDQANLNYAPIGKNNKRDFLLVKPIIKDLKGERINRTSNTEDDDLVIVTNTTTKSAGLVGCAIAVATKKARKLVLPDFSPPMLVGFDESSSLQAGIALAVELEPAGTYFDAPSSFKRETLASKFRRKLREQRGFLINHLEFLFPGITDQDYVVVEGARLLINAERAGKKGRFPTAKKLCDYLHKEFSIATKPASVYVSRRVKDRWDKYVQITIPTNDEGIHAIKRAFAKLKEEYDC